MRESGVVRAARTALPGRTSGATALQALLRHMLHKTRSSCPRCRNGSGRALRERAGRRTRSAQRTTLWRSCLESDVMEPWAPSSARPVVSYTLARARCRLARNWRAVSVASGAKVPLQARGFAARLPVPNTHVRIRTASVGEFFLRSRCANASCVRPILLCWGRCREFAHVRKQQGARSASS